MQIILYCIAWTALMTGIVASAFRLGGFLEKYVASSALLAWLLSVAAAQRENNWAHPQTGLLVVDAAFLAALLLAAMRTSLLWPLVATGFQLCSVALHLAELIHPEEELGYLAALQIPSTAVIGVIFYGTVYLPLKSRHSKTTEEAGQK